MSRSLYKPHPYSNLYLYSHHLRERDPYFSKKLEELLIARAKLTKQQRVGVEEIRFKFIPRNLIIRKDMVGLFIKIQRGKGWINIKFTDLMVGLRVGALTHTRAISPIRIHEKNIKPINEPIRGKRDLIMAQPDRPKNKKQKKRRKK
jgi:ribosomal protein S19